MTIQDFITKHGLAIQSHPAPADARPAGDAMAQMDHWFTAILVPGGRRMSVLFSSGKGNRMWKRRVLCSSGCDFTAHDVQRFGYKPGARVGALMLAQRTVWAERVMAELTEPAAPELATVLDCVALDAQGYDDARNFEDWCAQYGYDTDSRKAEQTYRTVAEQAKELRHLIGADAYAELLSDVERL